MTPRSGSESTASSSSNQLPPWAVGTLVWVGRGSVASVVALVVWIFLHQSSNLSAGIASLNTSVQLLNDSVGDLRTQVAVLEERSARMDRMDARITAVEAQVRDLAGTPGDILEAIRLLRSDLQKRGGDG